MECIGSRAELEKLSGEKVTDLHKHFVDEITFPCARCGGTMRRIPEVLDCWFESGAMPYAPEPLSLREQGALRGATSRRTSSREGLDQTRGWFYTLMVLGAALFDKPAFQNVVVNGLVLGRRRQEDVQERRATTPTPWR